MLRDKLCCLTSCITDDNVSPRRSSHAGSDPQEHEEVVAKSVDADQEPYDPASGMFTSHDETQSGAFDSGATSSQDKRLDNLSTQKSDALTGSQTQDIGQEQNAKLLGTAQQVSKLVMPIHTQSGA